MTDSESLLKKHTVGPQTIGFDYQFYYFMLLSLDLKTGEKVGFEVKDDVHIDKEDGTAILFQTKHSVSQNSDGTIQNLTTLDVDLWKTLSNWTDFIRAAPDSKTFLTKYSFVLATNKSLESNAFVKSLDQYKLDDDFSKVWIDLGNIEASTENSTLKAYIKNVKKLGVRKFESFIQKLTIETGVDHIIEKVKSRIFEHTRQKNLVDPIFESLSSNLNVAKYTDIKDRKSFEISFDDFNKRFGKCFKPAFEIKPLPPRNLPFLLPENLEEQMFIKQLIDIGEVVPGSPDIRDYTMHMLKFFNDFSYWCDENILLPTEIAQFNEDSIQRWKNGFKSRYRLIQNKINKGEKVEELEEEIKLLGIDLIEFIRQQELCIPGYSPLGTILSNGHYYLLSDDLKIGWHFSWEKKYTK